MLSGPLEYVRPSHLAELFLTYFKLHLFRFKIDLRCPVFVEETTLSPFTDVASSFVSLQETALHRQLPCLVPRLLRYLAETFEDGATSNNTPFTISPLILYRTNFPKYEAQLGNIDDFPPTTSTSLLCPPPVQRALQASCDPLYPPCIFPQEESEPVPS